MSMQSYPDWAQDFARKYLSKTLNHFILHGNIRDYVMLQGPTASSAPGAEKAPEPTGHEAIAPGFQRFGRFLAEELFAARELVLHYDRAGGIQFRDANGRRDFMELLPAAYREGGKEPLPKSPAAVLSLLEKYFRRRVSEGKSLALIIDYAETIIPNTDAGSAAGEERNVLVSLLKWAQDPSFLAADFTIVLLSANLSDLNRSLVQSPFNASIQVDLPNEAARRAFILHFAENTPLPGPYSALSLAELATQTAGLSFVQLKNILAQAWENKLRISYEGLQETKKELIEAEAHDLLEFVETDATLDAVAGHAEVKKHLRQASTSLKQGQGDTLPMGYLVCGPVGTGKTFLVSCFAGEVGIPMVKLKNFRSQWQGVTEGNLEKILTLLDAMAPVAVMIDEADAYLGDRASGGDSGVSSRVFAKIASFMSNTANRGRIIWFLMTARPDLMPVDLKRQGRAEEHLALFYPETEQERLEIFEVMKRKTGLIMTKNEVPESIRQGHHHYSGADMEAALTRARFRAAAEGKKRVSPELLEQVLDDFIPPTYPEEIELQTLLAVKECTSKALLPERFRHLGREELFRRLEELRRVVS